MYAGPAGHVNTDDYLTGRAVDKTFEHFKLGGAEPLNLGKYHTCFLESLNYFSLCSMF